jgi:hypothetical protein
MAEFFKGTIVRIERDGFGIVRFDEPLGANTYGVFSTTISSTLPFALLKRGVTVTGTAETDNKRDLAAVKTLKVAPPS